MLCNQTDRIYCDAEDITYAAVAMVKKSNEQADKSAQTMKLNESIEAIRKQSIYLGAALALQVIGQFKVKDANEFVTIFDRCAFEQFTD